MSSLTIDIKRHSGLCSISNIIVWDTFVLAIVLWPFYIADGVLTVFTIFDRSVVIQIEPVLRHLWLSCRDVTCECHSVSLCDGISSCTSG